MLLFLEHAPLCLAWDIVADVHETAVLRANELLVRVLTPLRMCIGRSSDSM